MSRRKGERPIAVLLDAWSDSHPVAHAIRTGDVWFGAWQRQKCLPLAKLSRLTGIPVPRLMTLERGESIARSEVEALSRAWSVSAADLIASMPAPDLVID